jgi:hypothetical protein
MRLNEICGYILDDDKNAIPVKDIMEWANWFESAKRAKLNVVGQDTLPDGTFVSTVFLGLDHNFFDSSEHLKDKPEQLLSRKEAAGYLKVSLTTLKNWDESGYMKPKRFGRRVFYFESDLLERKFPEPMKTKKYYKARTL